jgi:hypothetical protein
MPAGIESIVNAVIGSSALAIFVSFLLDRKRSGKTKQPKGLQLSLKSSDALKKFIDDKLQKEDYDAIDIICHTGEQIIEMLFNEIKTNANFKNISIRVLIRNPSLEIESRALGILNSLSKIVEKKRNGFDKLDVHFYQNLPVFRAMILKRGGKAQEAFLSYYYFEEIGKPSKNYTKAILIDRNQIENSFLLPVFTSWFDHFWGKTTIAKQTLAIIFDFDDTIVNSHEIQIDAWVETVVNAKTMFGLTSDNFAKEFEGILGDRREIKTVITKIFFQEQKASEIMNKIFKGLDIIKRKEIEKERFDLRSKKMNDIDFFPGFESVLRRLCENYHLVIVSSTDEDVIEE